MIPCGAGPHPNKQVEAPPMKIEGRVSNITVSTVYRTGTSTGYGVKVGRMEINTSHGRVRCTFKGYTNYLSVRRGHLVRAVGEFENSEHGRVFRISELTDLDTGETWKFLGRNLEVFATAWCFSFVILAPIAIAIMSALLAQNPAPLLTQISIAFAQQAPASPLLEIPILITIAEFSSSNNLSYLFAVGISAFAALFIASLVENKITTQESYKKEAVKKTILGRNPCPACGAEIPPELNVCPECGEPLTRCALCKSNVNPADTAHCPHCASTFHRDHLLEWLKIKGTCPSCGRPLTPKTYTKPNTDRATKWD